MKNILFLTLLVSLKSQAMSIACSDAGGYYGNLKVTTTQTYSEPFTTIHAAQGFAYELSEDLGLPQSARLSVSFAHCEMTPTLVRCTGNREIQFYGFDDRPTVRIPAKVNVTVALGTGSHWAHINIQTKSRLAKASHNFKKPLGECRKTIF